MKVPKNWIIQCTLCANASMYLWVGTPCGRISCIISSTAMRAGALHLLSLSIFRFPNSCPCCQDCYLFFLHIVLICSSCAINVGSTTSFWLSYRQASHCSVIHASVLVSTSRGKHALGCVLHPVSSFGLRSTRSEQFLHSSQLLCLICVIARFAGHGMSQCCTCGSD